MEKKLSFPQARTIEAVYYYSRHPLYCTAVLPLCFEMLLNFFSNLVRCVQKCARANSSAKAPMFSTRKNDIHSRQLGNNNFHSLRMRMTTSSNAPKTQARTHYGFSYFTLYSNNDMTTSYHTHC